MDGERDVLGLWAGEHGDGEGAKYWLRVLSEIKNRGVRDVCMLVCDGLKGLPNAVSNVWEKTIVQTCIVHLLRNSFKYASKRDWAQIAKDLKPVYTARPNQRRWTGAACDHRYRAEQDVLREMKVDRELTCLLPARANEPGSRRLIQGALVIGATILSHPEKRNYCGFPPRRMLNGVARTVRQTMVDAGASHRSGRAADGCGEPPVRQGIGCQPEATPARC